MSPTFKLGRTIDRWGPAAWNTLHVFAQTAPKRLNREEQEEWRIFLLSFANMLPCVTCRSHFSKFLQAEMTDKSLETRDTLIQLLNMAHNDVNRRLGKRSWGLTEHNMVYGKNTTEGGKSLSRQTLILIAICIILHATLQHKKGKLRAPVCNIMDSFLNEKL
jgi:hypothetical protein